MAGSIAMPHGHRSTQKREPSCRVRHAHRAPTPCYKYTDRAHLLRSFPFCVNAATLSYLPSMHCRIVRNRCGGQRERSSVRSQTLTDARQ